MFIDHERACDLEPRQGRNVRTLRSYIAKMMGGGPGSYKHSAPPELKAEPKTKDHQS